MSNTKKTEDLDLNRRDALKRLGLAVGAAYMTPTLLSLGNAHASSGGSGGGSGGSGGSDGSSGSDASDASEPSDDEQATANTSESGTATSDGSTNPITSIVNLVSGIVN